MRKCLPLEEAPECLPQLLSVGRLSSPRSRADIQQEKRPVLGDAWETQSHTLSSSQDAFMFWAKLLEPLLQPGRTARLQPARGRDHKLSFPCAPVGAGTCRLMNAPSIFIPSAQHLCPFACQQPPCLPENLGAQRRLRGSVAERARAESSGEAGGGRDLGE